MTGTETFVQNTEAPPVPAILQREVSPGTGLSEAMQSMSIANGVLEQKRSDTNFRESEKSFPGTPTPTGKGGVGR